MKIKFIPATTYPQEEGKYLWRSIMGDVEFVTVRKFGGECCGGSGSSSYFGIIEFGGKNVEQYKIESFSEKVEFE